MPPLNLFFETSASLSATMKDIASGTWPETLFWFNAKLCNMIIEDTAPGIQPENLFLPRLSSVSLAKRTSESGMAPRNLLSDRDICLSALASPKHRDCRSLLFQNAHCKTQFVSLLSKTNHHTIAENDSTNRCILKLQIPYRKSFAGCHLHTQPT